MKYVELSRLTDMTGALTNNELRRIDSQIKTFIGTPELSVPGSRSFGIDPDIVDMPAPTAESMLLLSITQKSDQYFSDINIVKLETEIDMSGNMHARLHVMKKDQG